jgi:hypothetical protein
VALERSQGVDQGVQVEAELLEAPDPGFSFSALVKVAGDPSCSAEDAYMR